MNGGRKWMNIYIRNDKNMWKFIFGMILIQAGVVLREKTFLSPKLQLQHFDVEQLILKV